MNNFYIDNGININAAWEKHIAISTDGVRWETFSKDGLNVIPAIRQANTNSPLTDKVEKCIITLTRTGEEDPAFFFDVDNVANQPTWTTPANIITRQTVAVEDITTWLSSCCGAGAPAGATESTLQSVLEAIQDGQDFESKLVVDDNGNGDTYIEVRIWNPDTQTWETPLYYAAGSNTGVLLGSLVSPIVYVNPSALLNTIATNTLGLATEVTLASLLSAFNSEDFATESTLGVVNTNLSTINTNVQLGNIILGNLLTTLATEATLLDVETAINVLLTAFNAEDFASQTTLAALLTELQAKADLTETQPVSLPTGVHSVTNSTVVSGGSVPAGAKKVYFQNIGTTDATVLGGPLEPGVSIPFEAEVGKTLPAFAYVASATAILKIVTVV